MTNSEINHINSADVILDDTTDVMKQYLKIKRENPGAILLYRLGDFYETFFEDAELLSRELQLTLTGRDAGKKLGRVPLAGIPVKAVDNYLEKLVAKDYKIAICEQLEDPKLAKGLVDRGVVRVITAGTLVESKFLNQTSNNYICALFEEKGNYGFAYTDISTGEFKAATLGYDAILTELARLQPSEVIAPSKKLKLEQYQIVPEEVVNLPDEITDNYNCVKVPMKVFEDTFAQNNLKNVFKLDNLDSLPRYHRSTFLLCEFVQYLLRTYTFPVNVIFCFFTRLYNVVAVFKHKHKREPKLFFIIFQSLFSCFGAKGKTRNFFNFNIMIRLSVEVQVCSFNQSPVKIHIVIKVFVYFITHLKTFHLTVVLS